MRINCHAHVFNAKSVFNKYTVEILINRINEVDLPDILKNIITKQLKKVILDVGDYIDEKSFYEQIIKQIAETEEYKRLLNYVKPSLKAELQIIGSGKIEKASAEVLAKLISKIYNAFDSSDDDIRKQNIIDILDFLRIILQPSVRNITDILINQLPMKTDAIVALTMDITEDGIENRQFEQQIKETSGMVLAYPGRIFPFVAVNPNRSDYFQIMERALNGMGYVGVKLYPSLGYDINSIAMKKVYSYCNEREIPILMHCSKGGFKHSDAYKNNSSPSHWGEILREHNNLKICFGHFGGDEYHAGLPEIDDTPPWAPDILDLMSYYPNVYTDISYHTAPMDGGDVESRYFNTVKNYLNDPTFKKRILWGSDFFLVRMRLKEKNHWNYVKKMLGDDYFNQMSISNAMDYLGFKDDKMSWALKNYIRFIGMNAHQVETKPPTWIEKSVKKDFGNSVVFNATLLGPAWTINNKAHLILYNDFNEWEFLKKTPFDESGILKLSAMIYWRDMKSSSSQIAAIELRKRAVKIIKKFKQNNAVPALRNGRRLKQDQIIKILMPVLKDGSKTLAELGAICDSLFDFKIN